MNGLLKGEITLTVDIILGLILGEIIISLKLPDILLKRLIPFLERMNIPSVTGLAIALSTASSRAGAAVISSALENGKITERSAIWSVLMLPFPSYLRRWPSTFLLSLSMAGNAGIFFALSLIFRSTARFFIALFFLRRENHELSTNEHHEINFPRYSFKIASKIFKTLPVAWVFFALSYSLVPVLNDFFKNFFSGHDTFIPLSGWAVSAGSISHVSAALALAGGSMSSGELNTAQAVFALILGSGLGTATRILRQNAGYYFGLFPSGTACKMMIMNFATIIPLIMLNLIFAGLALLL